MAIANRTFVNVSDFAFQELKIHSPFRQGIEGLAARCQKGESGIVVNMFSFWVADIVQLIPKLSTISTWLTMSLGGTADSSVQGGWSGA